MILAPAQQLSQLLLLRKKRRVLLLPEGTIKCSSTPFTADAQCCMMFCQRHCYQPTAGVCAGSHADHPTLLLLPSIAADAGMLKRFQQMWHGCCTIRSCCLCWSATTASSKQEPVRTRFVLEPMKPASARHTRRLRDTCRASGERADSESCSRAVLQRQAKAPADLRLP
jgi:hypothetical protein